MKRKCAILAAVLMTAVLMTAAWLTPALQAQSHGQTTSDNRIVIGERIKFHSNILNEERTLLIYLPPNYQHSTERYPVLYLLDGTWNFHHVTAAVQFLSAQRLIPRMIVAGLANTDRNRDFLPTHMNHIRTSGGGDNFLKFIETEWIPYMDKHFRAEPYRILVGHSFGGLFSVYAMLTKPDLFNAYIAISPSLHWDNMLVLKKAQKFFKKRLSFKKFLYMSMGNETRDMILSIQNFSKILKNHAPRDFRRHYEFMKKETHNSTPLRTVYNGLEMLYDGWRLPQKTIAGGLKAIEKHYGGLSKKFGYTVPVPEAVLNNLGYHYLRKREVEKALEIFQLNVERFPGSANVYDSLGEALETAGQFEAAKKNYQLALEKGKNMNLPGYPIFAQHLQRVMKRMETSK